MTVKELISELQKMPQDAKILAEGETADKVVLEDCFGNVYVRIFKSWDVEFTGRFVSDPPTEIRKAVSE